MVGTPRVIAAVVALTFVVTAPAAAQQATPCSTADALRAAGLFDQAAVLYGELLKKEPVDPCVISGLKALADARSATAAKSAYDTARKLESQGFRDDAVAALKKAIAAHPDAAVETAGLYVGRPGFIQFWDAWIAPTLSFVLAGVGHLLTGLALLLALGLMVLAIVQLRRARSRWQFRVADLAASDAALGKTVAAAINHAIWQLETDGGGDRMWRGEWNAGQFGALAALTGAAPQLKAATLAEPLLRLIWPARTITVAGALHPPSDRLGVGVTLTVTAEGDDRPWTESATLWEHDFEPWRHQTPEKDVAGYYRLINLAAVWTEYTIDRHFREKEPEIQKVTLTTPSWRSYALYASGADWDDRGEDERAARQYLRALELDPRNWLAELNLANDESVLADPEDKTAYEATSKGVLDRLARVEARLEARPTKPEDLVLDPSRYRVAYLQMAVELERAFVLGTNLDSTRIGGIQLAKDVLRALDALERKELPDAKERALRELLLQNEGKILSGLAVVLAKHDPKNVGVALFSDVPKTRAEMVKALEAGGLGHRHVAGYVIERTPPSRDAFYNLAAYRALLATSQQEIDLAFADLVRAAKGQAAEFAKWPERDPSLGKLRDETHEDRLRAILKTCTDLRPYEPAPQAPAPKAEPTQYQIDLTVKSPVGIRTA